LKGLCKNCGSTELAPLYEAPAFDSETNGTQRVFGIARCSSCQLVNTTGEELGEVADAYTIDYYGSANDKFLEAIERCLNLANTLRAKKILRIWRKGCQAPETPSVLDIGCGRGHLLQAFKSLGASVLGLERQEFPIEHTNNSFIRMGSIDDHEYAESKFDIIILWHVFEHLERHDALLNDIADHLNDKGLLIIAVPNFSSIQQYLFSKYWFHLDLPRHLVHFESRWLMQHLTNHGYSVEAKGHMDSLQNIFGFTQSAMNFITPNKLNKYYRLLKHGDPQKGKSMLSIISWSLLAVISLPFAILESIISAILQRGATVQFSARLKK
jgi:SAM-dependent methyltransferase